jgi:hypothetical protein
MNNFEQLYQEVQKIERGYTPNDQGAPAYGGINKKWQPQWPGWKKLDEKKAAGLLKAGAFFPDLEPLVKGFYLDFWKPVRVDEINSLPVAQLLVDMKTQHGMWAQIISVAYTNASPLHKVQGNVFTTPMLNWINTDTATAYTAIAAARLDYVKKVKLQNEADRKGIIARAQLYVNAAAAFFKNNVGTATGGLLLAAAFFF